MTAETPFGAAQDTPWGAVREREQLAYERRLARAARAQLSERFWTEHDRRLGLGPPTPLVRAMRRLGRMAAPALAFIMFLAFAAMVGLAS